MLKHSLKKQNKERSLRPQSTNMVSYVTRLDAKYTKLYAWQAKISEGLLFHRLYVLRPLSQDLSTLLLGCTLTRGLYGLQVKNEFACTAAVELPSVLHSGNNQQFLIAL